MTKHCPRCHKKQTLWTELMWLAEKGECRKCSLAQEAALSREEGGSR